LDFAEAEWVKSGAWGSLFKNEDLEALMRHTTSLKAAGLLPGHYATVLRRVESPAKVRQPHHPAAAFTIQQRYDSFLKRDPHAPLLTHSASAKS
jgi:hypothetical protein